MVKDSRPPRPRHRLYAALYDLGCRLCERGMAPLREFVAGEAAGRVLEIGAGTGANLPYYRWAFLDAVELTEPDPFMLRRAERRAARMPPYAREKLRLTEAPAEALPFPDAAFDTVVATLVLCSVRELERAVAEVRRVLKPGGCFRFLEHVGGGGAEAKVQRAVQPVYGLLAAGCHLTRRTEDALHNAGFAVEVERRPRFGPLFPAILGVARKAQGATGEEDGAESHTPA